MEEATCTCESGHHLEHVADTGHLVLIVAELQPPAKGKALSDLHVRKAETASPVQWGHTYLYTFMKMLASSERSL